MGIIRDLHAWTHRSALRGFARLLHSIREPFLPRHDRALRWLLVGYIAAALGMLVAAGPFVLMSPLGHMCLRFSLVDEFSSRVPPWLRSIMSLLPVDSPEMWAFAILVTLWMHMGAALRRWGRRIVARPLRHLSLGADTILYLRPFAADHSEFDGVDQWGLLLWLGLLSVSRYEEYLAFAFRKIGRLVAVGDPNDRLPQLGASRLYTEDLDPVASWQTVVSNQIKSSKLTLLCIGVSDSLAWEVRTIVAHGDPRRLVLCIHGAAKRAAKGGSRRGNEKVAVAQAWFEFRGAFESLFPRGLPAAIGDVRFVRFDSDWTAVPVRPRLRKIAWFIPGRDGGPPRHTVDGALDWLSSLLLSEPQHRMINRLAASALGAIPIFASLVWLLGLLCGQ